MCEQSSVLFLITKTVNSLINAPSVYLNVYVSLPDVY